MDRHARTVVCLVALLAVTASVVPIVGVPGAPVASEPTASAGSAVSNATASAGARATDDDGADVLSRGVRERLAAVRENGVSGVPFRVYVHTTPGEVERVARQVRERGRVRDVLVGERAVAATLTADALTDVASLDPVTEISREAQYALTAADRKAPARRGSTADVPAVARPARASSDLRTPTTTPGGNDSWGVQYVDAGPLHARGVNGSNVTVAVIDSGIDEAATPLDDHVVAERYFGPDPDDGNHSGEFPARRPPVPDDRPTDLDGHGTSVAGIVAAPETTVTRPDGQPSEIVGVAPDASLLDAKAAGLSNLMLRHGPDVKPEFGNATRRLTDDDTEYVNVSQNALTDDARWTRVRVTWESPSNNVSLTLLDENGNPVAASHGPPSETSTTLHVNRTRSTVGNAVADVRLETDDVSYIGTRGLRANVTVDRFARRVWDSDLTRAIDWAAGTTGQTLDDDPIDPGAGADPTADVIALTISTPHNGTVFADNATARATRSGTLVVASAGNYSDPANRTVTPLKGQKNVVTVGAINRTGNRTPWSRTGHDAPGTANDVYAPDLVAPGTAINSTGTPTRVPQVPRVGSGTDGTVMSGTSQAAAHVAGVAALYVEQQRALRGREPSPEGIAAALLAGTTEPGRPAIDPAGTARADDGAGEADVPLSREIDQDWETGAGVVNARETALSFVVEGVANDTTAGDTDAFVARFPDSVPRRAYRSAGGWLTGAGTEYREPKGVLFWNDTNTSAGGIEDAIELSNQSSSGTSVVVGGEVAPGGLASVDVDGRDVESDTPYAVGVAYPPAADQRFDGRTLRGYRTAGNLTLRANASAAYAVPINRSFPPTGEVVRNEGGLRALGYWNATARDVDVRLVAPDGGQYGGAVTTNLSAEQAVAPGSPGGWKLVYDGAAGPVNLTPMVNYPVAPLPSRVDVAADAPPLDAGDPSDPSPVSTTVTVAAASNTYPIDGFDRPTADQFTVAIGGTVLPADAVRVVPVDGRHDRFRLVVTPPPSADLAGSRPYDLTVWFEDRKLGVVGNASGTATDAVTFDPTVDGSEPDLVVDADADTYAQWTNATVTAVVAGPGVDADTTPNATVTWPSGATRTVEMTRTSTGVYRARVPTNETGTRSSLHATVEVTVDGQTLSERVGWNVSAAPADLRNDSVGGAVNATQSERTTTTVSVRRPAGRTEGARTYVRMTDLTSESGDVIDASRVRVGTSVGRIEPGESLDVVLDLEVPVTTDQGTYEGQLVAVGNGTRVAVNVTARVPQADRETIRRQIQVNVEEWTDAPTAEKKEHEDQIADQLTQYYFDTAGGVAPSVAPPPVQPQRGAEGRRLGGLRRTVRPTVRKLAETGGSGPQAPEVDG